jgi:hypothetical protein
MRPVKSQATALKSSIPNVPSRIRNTGLDRDESSPVIRSAPTSNRSRTRQIPESFGPSILELEISAAQEAIESGLYICWLPHPSTRIPASASSDLAAGKSQCCRVWSQAICMCGHTLDSHQPIKKPLRAGYIKPPKCTKCSRCPMYSYAPHLPEECGQWWLKRRPDFNLVDWQKVIYFLFMSFVFSD